MKILALDLGKFNSVSCFYDTKTQATEYWTCASTRSVFDATHGLTGFGTIRRCFATRPLLRVTRRPVPGSIVGTNVQMSRPLRQASLGEEDEM